MREYNGAAFANFNLNARLSDGKTRVLYSCTAWGKKGQVADQYIKPGMKLVVNGEIKRVVVLPAKEDGEEMPCVNINVVDFDLPPKSDGPQARAQEPAF